MVKAHSSPIKVSAPPFQTFWLPRAVLFHVDVGASLDIRQANLTVDCDPSMQTTNWMIRQSPLIQWMKSGRCCEAAPIGSEAFWGWACGVNVEVQCFCESAWSALQSVLLVLLLYLAGIQTLHYTDFQSDGKKLLKVSSNYCHWVTIKLY